MSDAGKARLFLAVGLDRQTRELLASHLDASVEIPGRVVPPENWHVTLRFLGWADTVQRDRVLGYVDEQLRSHPVAPFSMRFGRLGAFPKPRRATVLWLGIERGEDPLARLAEVCEEAAVACGFAAEERPYHAHLTLSRIRPPLDLEPLVEGSERHPIECAVDRVTLFRSTLLRGGPRYEAIEEIALR